MINLEQAAKEYANSLSGLTKENENTRTISITFKDIDNYLNSAFKSGAEFAQQWISVNDEFPEIGLKIECKNERDSYYCGVVENRNIDHSKRLIVCGMFHGSRAIDLLYNFTHWRPIERK